MKPTAPLASAALALTLVVLFGCQDTGEPTQPSTATAAVSYRLTISGLGTGNGQVISSPAGINCTITAGKAATTGCSALFSQGVTVALTAKPAVGHAFGGWGQSCTGLSICKVRMGTNRLVSAEFRKGPFTIKISSGTPGGGSGTVRSQTGLTPAINCTITNGTPATTGCSATYPANTLLTLTATPAAGFIFNGWREPGCGTGKCQISVIGNKTIAAPFVPIPSSSPALQGKWDSPFNTPVVVVHMHLLANGKVLLWGDTGDAQLWSAATGFTRVPKTYRIYCSGHALMKDGRLLVVGGTSAGTRGLKAATVFNPATSGWSATAPMRQGRYYPTITLLPNGDLLAVSGHDTTLAVVTIPEVWNGSTWRRLTTAPLSIPTPYYPAMFLAPNGKVFLAGFSQPTRYLDVSGTGQWTTVGPRVVTDRVLGSAVMYAPGKILYAGGGSGAPQYVSAPTASAEVIDLTQAAPAWRSTGSMAFPRRQMNATILADGSVLVTGGTSAPGFNNQAGAIRQAELWNPKTGEWTTMATEYRNRTYHGTALLLPSGKVLSSGSGEGGEVSYANSEFSGQIFSPPYLFKPDGTAAPRPTISSAPATISYGQTFTVQTPNAATVHRGTLIRLSSVTHAFNASQLAYPFTFGTSTSTSVSAVAPANANLAPPGPYMLFLINDSGVPSVAKIVMVGQ
jgi:WD40 repeat protein